MSALVLILFLCAILGGLSSPILFSPVINESIVNNSCWSTVAKPNRPTLNLSNYQNIIIDELSHSLYSDLGQFTDSEHIDAIERYFWGRPDSGIVMEIGALDGLKLSVSRPFLKLGWHRILVEGAPHYRSLLKKNSPDACSFSAAICNDTKKVHYSVESGVGGIIEFMSDEFRQSFHKSTLYKPYNEWHTIKNIKIIPCLPLRSVLSAINVSHINLWILDVEGAELEVMRTVDFTAVKFDVIAVETDAKFRPGGFKQHIIEFLRKFDYVLSWDHGRNSWFTRSDFVPMSRPEGERFTRADGFKKYPDETFVKAKGHMSKTVWFIRNGTRHAISTMDSLNELLDRYKLTKKILLLDKNALDIIPFGEPL